MLQRLVLRNDHLSAEVLPEAGGGLSRLDWLLGPQALPLLRPLAAEVDEIPPPGQLACFPLVPWSNRIAPGGFSFEGRRHVPTPNREGEACPIHGDGWLQQWMVAAQDAGSVTLALDRSAAQPFSYAAELRYTLDGPALIVELSVRNDGGAALPFGLGLHPWMPDPQGARLQARAEGVWRAGADKLPLLRQQIPAHWAFDDSKPLPLDGVDNAFDGWGGRARIAWPARGVALELEADMDYFILYVPPGRDFFCFEPVDHPINAHNLSGYPGLTVLAPGATLRRRCMFRGETL